MRSQYVFVTRSQIADSIERNWSLLQISKEWVSMEIIFGQMIGNQTNLIVPSGYLNEKMLQNSYIFSPAVTYGPARTRRLSRYVVHAYSTFFIGTNSYIGAWNSPPW